MVAKNANRFLQFLHPVLESNIDQPLKNVMPRYEDDNGTPSRDFDLLASRHEPTAILPPRGTITYPLVQAMQSPPSAICVVEWTDPQWRGFQPGAELEAEAAAAARKVPRNTIGPLQKLQG